MKTLKSIDTREMTRPQWLGARKRGIGGSDVAGILGISNWASPLSIYLYKIGESPIEDDENEAMYWGLKLEDVIAQEYSNVSHKKIRRCNRMIVHPEHDFLLANIDRDVVGENAGLEVKMCSDYVKDEWKCEGFSTDLKRLRLVDIPMKYLCQCLHYMECTGCDRWYIAVLIGGNKFRWGVLERTNYRAEIVFVKNA